MQNKKTILDLVLGYNSYDFTPDVNRISVTSLLKPARALALNRLYKVSGTQLPREQQPGSFIGTAVHEHIENMLKDSVAMDKTFGEGSWAVNPKLGNYPKPIKPNLQIFFTENRTNLDFNIEGEIFTLSGKYDLIHNGCITDYKTGTVYSYLIGDVEDYVKQCSIYRYMNSALVTTEYCSIVYVLKDWTLGAFNRALAKEAPYPEAAIFHKEYPLLSLQDTEKLIQEKLQFIASIGPMSDFGTLPRCTDKELWITPEEPVFKYYQKTKAFSKRATKVFSGTNAEEEANAHMHTKGIGDVHKHVKVNEPKRCLYCEGLPVCEQAASLGIAVPPGAKVEVRTV